MYKGLQDLPTLTELCALALYSQAISRPYLGQVRGGGMNHLDLGPLHDQVCAHCQRIINSPDLLLAPNASHVTGTLGGKPWHRPAVMEAIWKLTPLLPHLPGVLRAFFEGALETWQRFCKEFTPGGKIAGLTAVQRKWAWMPSTNDDNEGALGASALCASVLSVLAETLRTLQTLYQTKTSGLVWAMQHFWFQTLWS